MADVEQFRTVKRVRLGKVIEDIFPCLSEVLNKLLTYLTCRCDGETVPVSKYLFGQCLFINIGIALV